MSSSSCCVVPGLPLHIVKNCIEIYMLLQLDWCWKKLGTQVGFEPTTSQLRIRYSTVWVTGVHILPPATYVTYPVNCLLPGDPIRSCLTWMNLVVDEFIALYGSWSAFAHCEKLYWHIDVVLARLVLEKVKDPGGLQTHNLLIICQVLYCLSYWGPCPSSSYLCYLSS